MGRSLEPCMVTCFLMFEWVAVLRPLRERNATRVGSGSALVQTGVDTRMTTPFASPTREQLQGRIAHGRGLLPLLLLVLSLCAFVSMAGSVAELHVQRVLQFERTLGREKNAFGPQAAAFRGVLAPIDVGTLTPSAVSGGGLSISSRIACFYSGGDMLRSVLSSRESHSHATDALAQILSNDQLAGAVFTEEVFAAFWSALNLTHRAFPFPVFVAPSQPGLETLLQDVVPAAQERLRGEVVLRSSDARKGTPTARDWPKSGYAVLAKVELLSPPRGTAPNDVDERLSILVTSTFDVVGVTPSRSFADVSGAAAAVALAASFANATTRPSSQHSSKSLQLLFSNFGRLNYAATREWLAHQPKAFVSATDLVICLDTLLPPQGPTFGTPVGLQPVTLYLHMVPGAEQLPAVAQFVDQLKRLAASQNSPAVEVSVVPRKINTTHHDLRFEHEVFAHKKLPALTISTVAELPEDQLVRFYRSSSSSSSSYGDGSSASASERSVRNTAVETATALIRGALAAVARIDHPALTAISSGELSDLVEVGLSTPNSASLFATRSPVQKFIEKSLKRLAKDAVTVKSTQVELREADISALVTFDPTTATVEVYASVDTLGELLLMGCIGAYVILFAVVTLGVETATSLVTGRTSGSSAAKLTKRR